MKKMMRTRELDSLRGLAALSVLGYHALATNFPGFVAGNGLAPVGTVGAIATFSPLHLLWMGAESVWLFFVLSGFVLTRSALSTGFSWTAYYPSRLVRLYLPVVFAVLLAWSTYLIPHVSRPGLDPLLPTGYSIDGMLHDMTLFGGTTTSLGVLWSLQWEVVFSLLLPVYILLVRSRPVPATVIALVGCVIGYNFGDGTLTYLPIFFVGALLAQYWPVIEETFRRLSTGGWRANTIGAALTALGAAAIMSYFLFGSALAPLYNPRVLTLPIVIGGIVLIIIVAQTWTPLSRVLQTRILTAAGTISFSLYLVHLPIVVLIAFILPLGTIGTAVSIAASLILATAFYLAVERPSHRLSRRVGSRIRERETAADAQDDRVPAGA